MSFSPSANLWALAAIRDEIDNLDMEAILKHPMLFTLSGIMLGMSRMNRYRPDVSYPTNIMEGTYYLPQISEETISWKHFENKFKKVIKAYEKLPDDLRVNSILYLPITLLPELIILVTVLITSSLIHPMPATSSTAS